MTTQANKRSQLVAADPKQATSCGITVKAARSSHSSSSSHLSTTAGTSRSVEESLCRICQCGPSSEDLLLSPCQCKGTLSLVHRSCLEMWLSQSNRTKCEICRTSYEIQRTAMSFSDWLHNPTTLADRRNMIADGICLAILLPLSTISSWLCVAGATHYLSENTDHGRGKYEAIGLIIVTMFLLLIFVGWFVIAIRYHFTVWREWHETHFQVCLLSLEALQPRPEDGPATSCLMSRMTCVSVGTDPLAESIVQQPTLPVRVPSDSNVAAAQLSAYLETSV